MSKEILLLHVPMVQETLKDCVSLFATKIAMGLFSISNELELAGFSTEIVNLGIEKINNYNFSISEYIKEQGFKIIFISLHWHFQTYDSIEVARKIKEENPNVFIVLGGFTASCFPKHILEKFPFIDAIVKGEGEIPSVKLAQKIKNNDTDFSDIPNLFWRKDEIIENKAFWISDENDLNSYSFVNTVEKLKNWELNFKAGIGITLENNRCDIKNEKTFICCAGRGCPGNCTWCGGGCEAMTYITGRKKVSLRSPQVIADEIITLKNKYGIEKFYFCFDPYPMSQELFIELFNILGTSYPKQIKVTFESDGLPTQKLINAFKRNLSDDSILNISPVFAQDYLRKEHRAFYYTTEEFIKCLNYLEEKQVKSYLYFGSLMNEDRKELRLKNELIEKLKKTYKYITKIDLYKIKDCEPYSPWALYPEKYNMPRDLVTFEDYYNNGKRYRELW